MSILRNWFECQTQLKSIDVTSEATQSPYSNRAAASMLKKWNLIVNLDPHIQQEFSQPERRIFLPGIGSWLKFEIQLYISSADGFAFQHNWAPK